MDNGGGRTGHGQPGGSPNGVPSQFNFGGCGGGGAGVRDFNNDASGLLMALEELDKAWLDRRDGLQYAPALEIRSHLFLYPLPPPRRTPKEPQDRLELLTLSRSMNGVHQVLGGNIVNNSFFYLRFFNTV
jgi:hypothetical protein